MILAIDPGKGKSGIAVVDEELTVYSKEIIASQEIGVYIRGLIHKYEIEEIVLGNGTTSDVMEELLRKQIGRNIPVHLVDEAFTTLEAEKRYREEHPLRGWKKIFNFLTWKPAEPVDDYVAVILAERYLQKKG